MTKFFPTAAAAILCAAAPLCLRAAPQMRADLAVSRYSGSAPLTNFPVLVRISEATIRGFQYGDCAPGGADIAFEDEYGNALPREIDTWDETGESLVWVRLPVLTNNAPFALTYRDPSVTAQPQCQTDGSVWRAAGYVGVWHMGEASGPVADATGHGLTATPGGNYTANSVAVSGKIGNARQNAVNASQPGNLVVTNYDSFDVGGTFAVGGWFFVTSNSSSDNRFFSRKENYQEHGGWEILHKGGQNNIADKKIYVRGKTNSKSQTSSGMNLVGAGWQHFVFVYDGGKASIYRNGQPIVTTGSIEPASDNGQTMGIGSYRVAANSCLVGNVDECRLLDAVPTADWVAANYATQSDPSFLTYGAVVPLADSVIAVKGSPVRYSSGGLPAYGMTLDPSEGAHTFTAPAYVSLDGTLRAYCIGWELHDGDNTLLRSSATPDAGESDLSCTINYSSGTTRVLTWLWNIRDEASVAAPTLKRATTSSLEMAVDVAGFGYGGYPALAIAYGPSGAAMSSTNVVVAAITASGTYQTTLNGLAPTSAYDVQALLLNAGGAVIAASGVATHTTAAPIDGVAIFLKADAAGAGDGTSWTDAFTSWSNAVVAVRAAGSEVPVTLYVAAGVYTTPSTEPVSAVFPTVFTNASFAVLGGCRAAYDGDVARDTEAHHTILTTASESNIRGAYWKRRVPDLAAYAHRDADVTDGGGKFTVLDAGGRLRFPDFTGDHDIFICSATGGNNPIHIARGASGVIDGLRIVGCGRASNRSGELSVAAGAGDVLITNCVFAGCYIQSGAIRDEGGTANGRRTTIADCKFLFNQFAWGNAGVYSSGNTTVRDCLFLGNSQDFAHNGDSLCPLKLSENGCIAEDCVLARNYQCIDSSSLASLASGPAIFRRLVVTNNVNLSKSAVANPMIGLRAKNGASGMLVDSLVADNIVQSMPSSGSVAVLVTGHATDNNTSASIIDTIFRGNAVIAASNNLAASSCAFGIVGNSSCETKGAWTTLEGCTFVSNRAAIANAPAGASPVLSRGVLSYSSASSSIQYGLANCTFLGPVADGVFDIAQYGVNTLPVNVVNCLFALDDPNAVAAPFSWTDASTAFVRDCAVQNWYPVFSPEGYGALTGVKYDPIPLAAAPTGVGGGSALRPAARTPGIRQTCDVATNAPASAPVFSFRTRDVGAEWQPLVPNAPAAAVADRVPCRDALGVARAFGATTIGAVQAMTDVAENGSTLTLRRDPFSGGTLSPPFVQAVADGNGFAPVTATPAAGAEFLGWIDAGGDVRSSDNPLALSAAGEDMVLTASFGTAEVTLTFDLGPFATFDASGSSTCAVTLHAGAPFPAIPAFTVRSGYVLVRWPDFPATVPYENARYEAKIVSTSVRRFYAAPGGTGDGSSWQSPAGLAAACEEAGAYRGEVWLKEGVYVLSESLPLRANVAIVGGFAGGEASAAAANPEAHPTIIAGCPPGNLYWKPNGNDPGMGLRPAVWTGGAFNAPNPGFADKYWLPASATAASDQPYAFAAGTGNVITNASVSGVVFTGFRLGAVSLLGAVGDGFEMERCRFIANGTAANADHAALVARETAFALRGCDFIGNYRNLTFNLSGRPYTNVVEDCRITDSANAGISCSISTNGSFEIARCLFARNYGDTRPPVLDLSSQSHFGLAHFDDCTFVSNRVDNQGKAILNFNCSNRTTGGREYYGTPCLEFRRCDFTDNFGRGSGALVVNMAGRYASIPFHDCVFARNLIDKTNGATSLVQNDSYMLPTFVNCLFESNSVSSSSDAGLYLLQHNNYRRSAFIGCTFIGNSVTGADLSRAADIRIMTGDNGVAHTIANCVFDERASGHWPIRADAKVTLRIWGVFTAWQTTSDLGEAALDVHGHSPDDPRIAKRAMSGPDGRPGRPLSSASRARIGVGVQQGSDGNYYIYRDWLTGNDPKFWSAQPDAADATIAQGAGLGLDPAGTWMPDAWGQPRPCSRPVCCGHVNALADATFLILK